MHAKNINENHIHLFCITVISTKIKYIFRLTRMTASISSEAQKIIFSKNKSIYLLGMTDRPLDQENHIQTSQLFHHIQTEGGTD